MVFDRPLCRAIPLSLYIYNFTLSIEISLALPLSIFLPPPSFSCSFCTSRFSLSIHRLSRSIFGSFSLYLSLFLFLSFSFSLTRSIFLSLSLPPSCCYLSLPPPLSLSPSIQQLSLSTFLFRGPRRADLASTAAYVSHSPVVRCWTKHMDSPYLISGMPMPSTSLFLATSIFSCTGGTHEKHRHARRL